MKNTSVSALLDLNHTIARALFEGEEHPWEVLPGLSDWIRAKGAALPPDEYDQIGEDVWIAKDAAVAPTAYLNGPLIVDHGAEIRHCAFVRGSAVVGKKAVVGNSVELKNCVLFDEVQVPHFNYVGDSVLGHRAHMGAGAVTSNVKGDRQPVVVHRGSERMETGLKKLGAMLGDYAEIGCGAVLNPGAVIGRGAQVYPLVSVRGTVPANCIHKGGSVVEKR